MNIYQLRHFNTLLKGNLNVGFQTRETVIFCGSFFYNSFIEQIFKLTHRLTMHKCNIKKIQKNVQINDFNIYLSIENAYIYKFINTYIEKIDFEHTKNTITEERISSITFKLYLSTYLNTKISSQIRLVTFEISSPNITYIYGKRIFRYNGLTIRNTSISGKYGDPAWQKMVK